MILILSSRLLQLTESLAREATSDCNSTPIIEASVFFYNIRGMGAFPQPISNIFLAFFEIVIKFGNNTESNEK